MGLMKKVRTRALMHNSCPREINVVIKQATPKAAQAANDEDLSLAFKVVSIPKEYSQEKAQSFNWLTNQMDSFEVSPCGTSSEVSYFEENESLPPANPTTDKPAEQMGWGEWLFSCFGSSPPVCKPDDRTVKTPESSETSYAGTGTSSEPSRSREGEILALPLKRDDVSDITSIPSIDCSEADSDDSPCDESTFKKRKSMVCAGLHMDRFDRQRSTSSDQSSLT